MSSFKSKLNKDFFKKIIEKHLKWKQDEYEILSVELSNACYKCTNHKGVLIRAKVTAIKDEVEHIYSYIIKSPTGGVLDISDALLLGNADKESFVYNKIIPEFESIWRHAGKKVRFGPKFYGVFNEPMTCIVMQDLCALEYNIENRPKGLDFEHAKMVIEKIAKFHAASILYQQKHGPFDDRFKYGVYHDQIPGHPLIEVASLLKEAFCKTIKSWQGFETEYEKINSWDSRKIVEIICKAIKNDTNGLTVLCHGDLWIENLMFADDSCDCPVDVRFIDFQVPYYSSPACDLLYFITMSLEENVRIEEFDRLVLHYAKHLISCLKELGYSNTFPSSKEIQMDVINRSVFAVILLFMNFLGFINDEGISMDISTITNLNEAGFEYRESLFTHPRFKRVASKYLKFLSSKGALDINI